MRKIMMALVAIFSVSGAASADDWSGSVKAQAAYLDGTGVQVDIAIDVLFDQTGPQGLAWGTMTYMRGDSANYTKLTAYYHAVCVGKFSGGDKLSVAAVLVKKIGTQAVPLYMTYEFDLVNKKWRTNATATLSAAQDTCKQQSGLFPGTFDHGFVVVK
jgi:hypothetical protein